MIKIVGNKDGQLTLEFDGKTVAIITDELFWNEYIDNINSWYQKSKQSLTKEQVEKICNYITGNIMDNIRSWELESVITDGIVKCQDEYIENYCEEE